MTRPSFPLGSRARLGALILAMFLTSVAEARADARPPAQAYQGRFQSDCRAIATDLHGQDIVEIKPGAAGKEGSAVTAHYRQSLFAKSDCAASSLIVTLNLPPVTWTFDGTATVGGKKVDLVTVTGSAGMLTATIAQPARVTDTDENVVIRIGKDQQTFVGKSVDASTDKELRRLEAGTLYMGNTPPLDAQGYPTALTDGLRFMRQP